MKKMLNTLYVTSPDSYLALDGENIVVLVAQEEKIRLPLHNLEGIVAFGYTGASPACMGACAKRGISLCFMTQSGRFLARVTGEEYGNVLLRKMQYRLSDSETDSLSIARMMLVGKLYNTRWVVERFTRDHPLRVDCEALKQTTQQLHRALLSLEMCRTLEQLRGVEGEAASTYFSILNELILQQKEHFQFFGRNRRPPTDPVNAMLSFVYSMLANEVASALTCVGLDAYVGFLHRDRPGRISLALDMMEELRPVMADRLVLALINRREIGHKDFITQENGAVQMNDTARKTILSAWQERKKDIISHPYLNEKIPWGLVPHAQALLLARYLRGDLDAYPPFLWK